MISPRNTFSLRSAMLAGATMAALLVVSLGGCSDPPPPPPPPIAVAPPPPPPPPLTPISELMARYNIAPRVSLPEDRAPGTDPQRIAVLQFFDAFVRGNVSALTPLLSAPDQYQLENLAKDGGFEALAKSIAKCDVRCGSHASNDCTLAVFTIGDIKRFARSRMQFAPSLRHPNSLSALTRAEENGSHIQIRQTLEAHVRPPPKATRTKGFPGVIFPARQS